MPQSTDGFENFRNGLAAGHAAGREEDLLYAFGFVIGFLWGAIFSPRAAQKPAFQRAARSA